MDIEKLRSLCLVENESSFKKAAQKAGEKYATFRKQLLKLESDLNIPLFIHEGGKILLTPEGKEFVKHAKNIIQYADNQIDLFNREKNNKLKKIVISTTNALAAQWITDDIAEFIKNHSEIQITVLGSDLPLETVKYYDVAIRPRVEDSSNLLSQRLISTQVMCLYASEEYALKHGLPKTPDDLSHHRLIGYGDDGSYPYSSINWHLNLSSQKVIPFYNVNSGLGILRGVENGIGIGPVSNIGALISRVPLIRVLPEVQGPFVQLYFITDRLNSKSPEIIKFYEYIKNKYAIVHDYNKISSATKSNN